MTYAHKIFTEAYNRISAVIGYNPEWANGTGYHNFAVEGEHAVVLKPGEMAKAHSGDTNNRRMVFVGTALGTLVVFERFTGGEKGVLVYNASDDLRHAIRGIVSNGLTEDNVQWLLGNGYENVGHWLEHTVNAVNARVIA